MKKPEKRAQGITFTGQTKEEMIENRGYNQACDEWEEFLPDEKEISEILSDNSNWTQFGKDVKVLTGFSFNKLAKAIAERIGR